MSKQLLAKHNKGSVMFPNFTFGFVMFPSEKSNTSGLVPPAFTCGGNSISSANHLRNQQPSKMVSPIYLEFDTFCRSFTDKKALPTEADTCILDYFAGFFNCLGLILFILLRFHLFWIFLFTLTYFGFWPPPLACFSCARRRRRAGPWSPRWRTRPPGQA